MDEFLKNSRFLKHVHELRDFPYFDFQKHQHEYGISISEYIENYSIEASADCKNFYKEKPTYFYADLRSFQIDLQYKISSMMQLNDKIEDYLKDK